MAFFKNNGVNLYYELQGKGEPVLIVAGGGADARYYSGLSALLEKDFQVILMDPRGGGRSERGEEEYSFNLLASDIIALLDYLGIRMINLVGHSMGGMTAQYFACKHPERIKKLVLWATASSLSAFGRHCCKTAAVIKAEGSLKAFMHVMAIWNFSNEFLSDDTNLANLIAGAEKDPYPLSTEVFMEQMKIIDMFDCSAQLHGIKIPTLVIGCEKDIIFPVEGAKNLVSSIDGAEYKEIQRATHSMHIENPESISTVIKNYLLATAS